MPPPWDWPPGGAGEAAGGVHGHSTAPLNCHSSFDPYAYPKAAVSACGYQTLSRTAVHAPSTRWLGNGYRFYLYDYGMGTTDAFNVSSSTYSSDSAEAIAERPTINGSFSNLSNFGTMTFSETQANGVGMNSTPAAARGTEYT